MSSASSDCNLLFGILALQVNFITRDALVKGMNAWVLEKHRSLGEILVEQGALHQWRRNAPLPLTSLLRGVSINPAAPKARAMSGLCGTIVGVAS